MTAKEFWEKRFGESPKTDSEKLAVAMMAEYAEFKENLFSKKCPNSGKELKVEKSNGKTAIGMPRFYLGQEVITKDGKGLIVKLEMEWTGLYISPERSKAVVWFSTDNTQSQWINRQYKLSELNMV